MQITLSELKVNAGKYVSMVREHEIYITKNGKMVAKLVPAVPDKMTIVNSLIDILPADADFDAAKRERFA